MANAANALRTAVEAAVVSRDSGPIHAEATGLSGVRATPISPLQVLLMLLDCATAEIVGFHGAIAKANGEALGEVTKVMGRPDYVSSGATCK